MKKLEKRTGSQALGAPARKVAAPATDPEKSQQEILRRYVQENAVARGLDPNRAWRDCRRHVIANGWSWWTALGRVGLPPPSEGTRPPPEPTYLSFRDYLACTTPAERLEYCRARAQKANRARKFSPAPTRRLNGADVWAIVEAARGRCTYCGSLAVEKRPSQPNGAPGPWEHVGRRIGSLEHRKWMLDGGNNDPANLAWSCLWCNTWAGERRRGATDHGGLYPTKADRVP